MKEWKQSKLLIVTILFASVLANAFAPEMPILFPFRFSLTKVCEKNLSKANKKRIENKLTELFHKASARYFAPSSLI